MKSWLKNLEIRFQTLSKNQLGLLTMLNSSNILNLNNKENSMYYEEEPRTYQKGIGPIPSLTQPVAYDDKLALRSKATLMMQLETAQKCLAELQSVINDLEHTLAPVLVNPDKKPGITARQEQDMSESSLAVSHATDIVSSINQIIYRINDLRNSVDV